MCVQSPERVAVDAPVATRDLGAVMCVHDGYSWDSCQDDGLLRSTEWEQLDHDCHPKPTAQHPVVCAGQSPHPSRKELHDTPHQLV